MEKSYKIDGLTCSAYAKKSGEHKIPNHNKLYIRFILSIIFAVPSLVFNVWSMAGMPLPIVVDAIENPLNFALLQFGLTVPVIAVGYKFIIAGYTNLIKLSYYVPIVIGLAIAAAVSWAIAGEDFEFCLTIFVSVLVIACPCALGLAMPAAIMAGIEKGTENGIIIRDIEAFQNTYKIDTIIFDKTGIITDGKPNVTNIVTYGTFPQDELLTLAATAEKSFESPIAKAILSLAEERNLTLREIRELNALGGSGVSVIIERKKILLGSQKLMTENSVDLGEFLSQAEILAHEGKKPLFVSVDSDLKGIIAVAETVKAESKTAIEALHQMGIKVAMITGDNKNTANAIAKHAGIDIVLSEVLPQDKANEVEKLQGGDKVVAMVCNDISDVTALAQADVGIAIGFGASAVIKGADIVLTHNDLTDVITLIRLSKAAMHSMKQNLFWAFGYNILGIPVAMGVLHIFGGPLLNPMIVAVTIVLGFVSVLINTLRLKKFK